MPQTLADKMKKVQALEGFSTTEYVRELVRENLRKRGLLPDKAKGGNSAGA